MENIGKSIHDEKRRNKETIDLTDESNNKSNNTNNGNDENLKEKKD
jgi:hypothetical protein